MPKRCPPFFFRMRHFRTLCGKIFSDEALLCQGHGQDSDRESLGLGFLYYSFCRIFRPERIVCIGSWRGFVPMLFAAGQKDNQKGRTYLIDPSYVDDFWKDEKKVSEYFQSHGVDNIQHFCTTTQEFSKSAYFQMLHDIDFLFVDGDHRYRQVLFDFETFRPNLSKSALIFFHDSTMRGKAYSLWEVPDFLLEFAQHNKEYEMLTVDAARGLTILKRKFDYRHLCVI